MVFQAGMYYQVCERGFLKFNIVESDLRPEGNAGAGQLQVLAEQAL